MIDWMHPSQDARDGRAEGRRDRQGEIDDLENELAEMDEMDEMADEIEERDDRLEELEYIVSYLQKTVDGEPVYPGMDLWTTGDNGVRQVLVTSVNTSGFVDVTFHGVPEILCPSLNGYFTREAAMRNEELPKTP